MENYANLGGNSNVRGFEIGEDYIIVYFKGNSKYRYTYNSAGAQNIEKMKNLARQGTGLNSFINRHVKKNYESKGAW